MALELTIGLIAAAAVLFFVLRGRRKTNVDKAADAARKAVAGRFEREDPKDRNEPKH